VTTKDDKHYWCWRPRFWIEKTVKEEIKFNEREYK